ncbi:Uncharacterised protein [uncultured archaeon]|nr:Uncharacterised protein [uncultured archaeon]
MNNKMKCKGNPITGVAMTAIILTSVFVTIVPTVNAGISDGIGLQNYVTNFPDINGFNKLTEKITKPAPTGIYPGGIPQMTQLRETERKLMNSIPNPAMEYNAISFVEDLYKYQGYAMKAGSILSGDIPLSIPSNNKFNLPFLSYVKFKVPFDLGPPIGIDTPRLNLNPMSTGINLFRDNIKRDLQITKQRLTEPMVHNIEYKFRDYGISGFGKINIWQQWTPGGDLGTMTRNINKRSTYNIKIPDPSYSRQQIPQIRPISQSNYRMPGYSTYPRYR